MAKTCYEYAINLISKYPKTEKELQIKLYQKGYDSEMVQKTLERLKSDNFVNDELFAESYLNSEVMKKWKPLFMIVQKLIQKGIDKSLLKEITSKYDEDIQKWIYWWIKKEISKYKKKGVEGFDIIQKLIRKGYKLGDISTVLKSKE